MKQKGYFESTYEQHILKWKWSMSRGIVNYDHNVSTT